MQPMPEAGLLDQISKIITGVMKLHEDDPRISPSAIADEITDKIYQEAPDAIRAFVARHIRQIIGPKLRHSYEKTSNRRQLAFPDFPLIQSRYPTADGSWYIKSELMSHEDWMTNLHQLYRKGGKLIDHTEQLKAWGRERFGDNWAMEA